MPIPRRASMLSVQAPDFTISASPANVSGTGYGGAYITTNSTTVTPNGPAGYTYTYAWSVASALYNIVANSPAAATTDFTLAGAPSNTVVNVVAYCTVTRNDGRQHQLSVNLTFNCGVPMIAVDLKPDTSYGMGNGPSTINMTTTTTGGGGTKTWTWSLSPMGNNVAFVGGQPTGPNALVSYTKTGGSSYFVVYVSVTDVTGTAQDNSAFYF